MPSAQAPRAAAVPNDLEAYWLPFTSNRAFKASPRLIARAKDMHYYTPDGRAVLDGTAGLWCTNAGHNREPIVAAIRAQAVELDYAPAFQFSHPKAFELASRVAALAPADLDHVFFCNSGSEAVDTALKIALAFNHVRGEGARTRLIGRERGYHGVGFGGISVGGIVNNRKFFGSLLAGVDHLPSTYNREHQAFSKGEPEWGAHLADDLDRLVGLHDASTIAAVIVVSAGSAWADPIPPLPLASEAARQTQDLLLPEQQSPCTIDLDAGWLVPLKTSQTETVTIKVPQPINCEGAVIKSISAHGNGSVTMFQFTVAFPPGHDRGGTVSFAILDTEKQPVALGEGSSNLDEGRDSLVCGSLTIKNREFDRLFAKGQKPVLRFTLRVWDN
jgi:hypothetical protein